MRWLIAIVCLVSVWIPGCASTLHGRADMDPALEPSYEEYYCVSHMNSPHSAPMWEPPYHYLSYRDCYTLHHYGNDVHR